MPYCNSTDTKMYNFKNENYLNLLQEIVEFFKSKNSEFLGYDDTLIRYDDNEQHYVASVYILV